MNITNKFINYIKKKGSAGLNEALFSVFYNNPRTVVRKENIVIAMKKQRNNEYVLNEFIEIYDNFYNEYMAR